MQLTQLQIHKITAINVSTVSTYVEPLQCHHNQTRRPAGLEDLMVGLGVLTKAQWQECTTSYTLDLMDRGVLGLGSSMYMCGVYPLCKLSRAHSVKSSFLQHLWLVWVKHSLLALATGNMTCDIYKCDI